MDCVAVLLGQAVSLEDVLDHLDGSRDAFPMVRSESTDDGIRTCSHLGGVVCGLWVTDLSRGCCGERLSALVLQIGRAHV